MNTKQVIVIRRDLNMRKGKLAVQASHASMAFLTKGGKVCQVNWGDFYIEEFQNEVERRHKEEINHWLKNSFRKICVYVDSELELDDLHQRALDKGMISHIVEDNGATEFNGVKTKTCIAIGPHYDEKFMGLTDHLPLL